MKKANKSSSAGTEAEGSTNADSSQASQPIAKHSVSSRLCDVMPKFLEQMIKEENESLGKVGFYNQYDRETHANNKYCLSIVKDLIERRFNNGC
jgi:hypothetical protein